MSTVMNGLCALCNQAASKTCSNCKTTFYCSIEHQQSHWKEHKKSCRAFKIKTDNILGRHIVATNQISERTQILCEKPIVVAPKIIQEPICLGCYRVLIPDPKTMQFFYCKKCGWPMCNENCTVLSDHVDECTLISTKNGCVQRIFYESPTKKEELYSCIAPLRVLILQKSNPKKFASYMQLQSHHKERNNSSLHTIYSGLVIPYINKDLKLNISPEMILQITGIFDTNAFEIRNDGIKIRGIYNLPSMLSHDCIPNTKHSFFKDFEFRLFATVPINKNDIISATYTNSLWGTLARQRHLQFSKCFQCSCKRCSDPTEFGLKVGSFYCSVCKNKDSNSEAKLISVAPLKQEAEWKCEVCQNRISANMILKINDDIRSSIMKLNKSNPENLEIFLQTYQHLLHPTNSNVLEIKYALIQLYGSERSSPKYLLNVLSDDLLNRKIQVCHEMLSVAEKLEGGSSRFRGLLLNELHLANKEKLKRDKDFNLIADAEFQSLTSNNEVLLNLAKDILRLEADAENIMKF